MVVGHLTTTQEVIKIYKLLRYIIWFYHEILWLFTVQSSNLINHYTTVLNHYSHFLLSSWHSYEMENLTTWIEFHSVFLSERKFQNICKKKKKLLSVLTRYTKYSEFHSSYARPADSISYTAHLTPGSILPTAFNDWSTLVYSSKGGSTLREQGETVLLWCRKAYYVVYCLPAGCKTNETHCRCVCIYIYIL